MRLVRSLGLDHRRRHDPLAKDRRVGTAALPAERTPGLPRRAPPISIRWYPCLGDVVLASRVADDREVRVPLELVAAEAEGLVPEVVRPPGLHQRFLLRDHRHSSVRQISSHAYVSHSLCFVCKRTKDFFGARIRYATRAGKEARLPSRRTM